MKIFAVLGSPNKNGNTATLLNEYLKGVSENHSDVQIREVFLQEKAIKGCTGCNICKSGKTTDCVFKDDMNELIKDFENSDIIVFASPIYWYNITSQLKTFLDRLYALDFDNFPKGKKFIFLTTYGASDEASSGALNAIKALKDSVEFLGMDFIQKYGASGTINEYMDTPVAHNPQALSEAYILGKSLPLN